MSKDAEIERAFERAERDEERRRTAHCPFCGHHAIRRLRLLSGSVPAEVQMHCRQCATSWIGLLETDNEREK